MIPASDAALGSSACLLPLIAWGSAQQPGLPQPPALSVSEIDRRSAELDGQRIVVRGYVKPVDGKRVLLSSVPNDLSVASETCVDSAGVRNILVVSPKLASRLRGKVVEMVLEGDYQASDRMIDPHDPATIWSYCNGPMTSVKQVPTGS